MPNKEGLCEWEKKRIVTKIYYGDCIFNGLYDPGTEIFGRLAISSVLITHFVLDYG